MIFVIICLLVGMVLGQRFKVLVLVPAILLVVALSLVGVVARAEAFWPIAMIAVGAIASLQFGYLLGLGIRFSLVGVRANPSHANSLAGSTSTRRPAH